MFYYEQLQGKDLFGDEDDEVHEFADGEDEFDPLLDDEEDDEIIRKVTKVKGGHELLYIGSLKVLKVPPYCLLSVIHLILVDWQCRRLRNVGQGHIQSEK